MRLTRGGCDAPATPAGDDKSGKLRSSVIHILIILIKRYSAGSLLSICQQPLRHHITRE